MRTVLADNLVAISIANKKLHAAKCAECGAKMYPSSLLKPHRALHRLKHESLAIELRQLQDTIERMRIA
jgi:methionyl-tRNA synthetase